MGKKFAFRLRQCRQHRHRITDVCHRHRHRHRHRPLVADVGIVIGIADEWHPMRVLIRKWEGRGELGGEAVRRAIKGCIRELLGIKNSVKHIIHLLHSNLLVKLNNSFHFLLVYGVLPMCVLCCGIGC